jgi:hypothetical protein
MISLVGSLGPLSDSVEGGGGDPDSGIDFENRDTREIRRVSREKRWTITRDTACQYSSAGERIGRKTRDLLPNCFSTECSSYEDLPPSNLIISLTPYHSIRGRGAHHQDSHLSLIREGSCPVVKHPTCQPNSHIRMLNVPKVS